MKSMSRLLTVLGMSALMAAPAAQAQGNLRYSITVSKFPNESGWSGRWDVGHGFATILTDALQQSGSFIVLGDADMRQEAMGEQDLAASGRMAGGKKAPQIGRMTPAQLLVRGSITHVQQETTGGGGRIGFKGISLGGSGGKAEVNITIYLVDSATGQVKASQKVVGQAGRRKLGIGYSGRALGGLTGESDAPIIKLVSLIILEAFRNRASDIHLEPMEKRFRVRYRIDGVLHEVESPPKRLQAAIISRVKIMANMSIAEKRVPQDGRIQINVMGRDLDLRVSTVPSNHGESIVMRILDKQGLMLGLPQLGFLSDDQQTFERLIGLSDGIMLVTGPTGSGKTTTLYACLNQINRPDRKIITVEDPVEYQMSGINQVQVRADIGLTFAAALRSILRQAPNIIMIGEIRDLETAEHRRQRLADRPPGVQHAAHQRRAQRDHPSDGHRREALPGGLLHCGRSWPSGWCARSASSAARRSTADRPELRLLGPARRADAEASCIRGRGLQRLLLTGYRGRKGIFEIFVINDEVQHMIFDEQVRVRAAPKARELGMRTLREDGLRKVVAGMTTLEEVLRVTMGDRTDDEQSFHDDP
jgi:type II secretory ATPase GspE/PulE/Tfp pilus assembly ATPase PilB-like protein